MFENTVFDDFFELGGHSLLALRVISHIERRFSVKIPLRDFFQCRCVADLAEYIGLIRTASVVRDVASSEVYEL